jgi:predicted Zn-dependent protease
MTSADFKNNKIRLCLASLSLAVFLLTINACTVKHVPVQYGTIPKLAVPSPEAEEFGDALFQKLLADYDLDSDNQKRTRLAEVFNQLTKAAEVDHLPWHLDLLNGPEIVDIRAVHGNYIFVWSGVLDAVENDDELAGLLAGELAHTLTHQTDPVEFTITSEVLFTVAELATTLGIMVASQGAIAISGQGWMKWAYVEVTDLDPLDRKYSEEDEREAADIALLIISRTQYSPQALLDFWRRVAADESVQAKYERFSRSLTPQERVAMLEKLVLKPPEGHNQFAKNRPSKSDNLSNEQ